MPWTSANGISIHYEVEGRRGPVVVLLHEMGGTLDSWDAVAPGLAENYRVLRYDQRGQGLTEKVRAAVHQRRRGGRPRRRAQGAQPDAAL